MKLLSKLNLNFIEMNSKVKLSWVGFSARSPQTLRDIWERRDFTDVTLVTEDGTQIFSHQVILGSASTFFKRILTVDNNHNQQRPLLFLSGVKGSVAASLLDFIYLGECFVHEEDIDQFFKTGQDLAVEGIEEAALEDGYEEEGEVVAVKKNDVGETNLSFHPQIALDEMDGASAKEPPLKVEVEEEQFSDNDFSSAFEAFDISHQCTNEEGNEKMPLYKTVAADAASITGAADAASTVVTAGAASTILTESEEADLNCELWQQVWHDLENGASERDTAAKFRVGRKWIARRRKLQGSSFSKKSGQVLTNSEEKLLLDTLLLRQNLGVPLSRLQLRLAVQGLLLDVTEADPTRTTGWEDRSQFPNLNWVFRFMKRHKLSLRTKIPMKSGRESLTEEEVRFWAECTKEFFQKHKEITVDPRRILNLDESAISQDTNGLKVIVKVGTKGAVQARDGDRDYSTLVMCITAAGEILKPAVVMKGQRDVSAAHMQRLNFPEHLQPRILFAKKGFVDQPGMIKVLETVHQSCLDKGIELPVVLLLDCATCHLSKNAISRAEQLGLHLWYIHPCATSILQPLDISFFGPLKMGYKQRIQVAVGKGIKMTRWT